MLQDDQFDDELARMDELELATESELYEALSLNDPIKGLVLRYHPVVQSGTSLHSVIETLKNEKVGCVMVEAADELVGVMTERDFLLRAIDKKLDFTKEIVDDYMTPDPERLKSDDSIAYALNKMHVFGIRHIPIVNDENKIEGMISVKDVVAHMGNYFGDEIINLPPEPGKAKLDRPEGG